MGNLKDDYDSDYDVVPSWVNTVKVDHINGDIVISSGRGEWILMEKYDGASLEDTQ